jgi:hypothetical protein
MKKYIMLLYPFLLLILLSTYGCNDNCDEVFVMENLLEENVKIEGYYIPFDFPISPIEKGEFIVTKEEVFLLYKRPCAKNEEPSSFNALRVSLNIQGLDSLVFIFEDSSYLSYTQNDRLDAKNPMLGPFGDISGWSCENVGNDTYQCTFRISEAHKAAASR